MNLVRRPFRLTRIFGQVCRDQGLASALRLTALKCRGAFSSNFTSSITDRSAAGLLTGLRNDIADLQRSVQQLREQIDRDSSARDASLREASCHSDSLRNLTWLDRRDLSASRYSDTPSISVIMPVYNRADRVAASINSVIAQDYSSFELIVVDDGSDDDLSTVMAQFEQQPKVRLIRIVHSGDAGARNAGLAASNGEIIAHLDSDNRMYPGYLQAIGNAYVEHPDGQCATAAMLWDNGHNWVHVRHDHFDWDRLRQNQINIDTNCFSYRRSLWQTMGGWNESLSKHSDFELALRYTRDHTPIRIEALAAHYDSSDHPSRMSLNRASAPNLGRIRAMHQLPSERALPIGRGLKVLMCTYDYPQLSESYVDTELAWFTRQGVQIEVFSATASSAPGTPIVPVHTQSIDDAIDSFQPDLLHCHWLPTAASVGQQALAHNLPITVRAHSFEFSDENMAACSDVLAVRSIYAFPHLDSIAQALTAKSQPITACFDSQRFYPRFTQDRRLVLRAAACLTTKDLASFFLIAAASPQFRFVLALATVATVPDLPAQLEKINVDLGSPVDIRWNVPHDQMTQLVANAGVYLHTFGFVQPFGMPVSIAEAMACGAVVAAPDCAAARTYVGDCGVFYDSTAGAIEALQGIAAWTDQQWNERSVHAADHAYQTYADDMVLPAILADWIRLTEGPTNDEGSHGPATGTPLNDAFSSVATVVS